MRTLLFALIVAVPASACAQTYYLDIYNTAPESLVAFAQAPAGGGTFHPIILADTPVQGGGDSATVAFQKADGGCLRDLRLTFADGRTLIHPRFNVCRFGSYHTGRYWQLMREQYAETAGR